MTPNLPTELISLGPTNIQISPIGIGTWAWGDKLYWNYGRSDYTDADLSATFETSLAAGITWFDTAEVYGSGRSERLLGQFMKQTGQTPLIATKFMPFPWRLWQRTLPNALNKSLKRLGLRQIGLYQIHWPFPHVPIRVWANALADAMAARFVQAVGVSNYNAQQTRQMYTRLAIRGVPLATNQIEYSLLNRQPEKDGLLDLCRELNVTVIAYSPLVTGLLTGKYTPDNPPPGLRGRRYGPQKLAKIQPLLALMREIGVGHRDKTPAQVALNWLICKGTVPIPGAKNARQAQANAEAMGWHLTAEEMSALDKASDELS